MVSDEAVFGGPVDDNWFSIADFIAKTVKG